MRITDIFPLSIILDPFQMEKKHDRKWLVYSYTSHRIYCFCCKLFKKAENTTQLAGEGCKDWKNVSQKLQSHECSSDHITCMRKWFELALSLGKNEKIDKHFQEELHREKEHWKQVLSRIIVVVRTLATHNLPFRGSNEKIYEERNGVFLGIIQMIA